MHFGLFQSLIQRSELTEKPWGVSAQKQRSKASPPRGLWPPSIPRLFPSCFWKMLLGCSMNNHKKHISGPGQSLNTSCVKKDSSQHIAPAGARTTSGEWRSPEHKDASWMKGSYGMLPEPKEGWSRGLRKRGAMLLVANTQRSTLPSSGPRWTHRLLWQHSSGLSSQKAFLMVNGDSNPTVCSMPHPGLMQRGGDRKMPPPQTRLCFLFWESC